MTNNERIHVYSHGLIFISVCAPNDRSIESIEKEVNLIEPTGIHSQWHMSEEKTFSSGDPNPCQCNKDINRKHYLFNC